MTHKPPKSRSGPNRLDQSKGRPKAFWDEIIIAYLIKGGTNGWSWDSLVRRYQSQVTREELRAFLEALKAEGKVDSFKVPASTGVGAPKTVWRATSKILED